MQSTTALCRQKGTPYSNYRDPRLPIDFWIIIKCIPNILQNFVNDNMRDLSVNAHEDLFNTYLDNISNMQKQMVGMEAIFILVK